MSNYDQRQRYLERYSRQMRRELDEMGYGRRPQPVVIQGARSNRAVGYLVASASVVVLILSLSLSRLLS